MINMSSLAKNFCILIGKATYTIGGTICGAERCRHRGRFPRRPFVAM